MKYSKYIWAIEQLDLEEGEYLTEEVIEDAYDFLDEKTDSAKLAKDFLLNYMDEINEYNDYDEDEEDICDDEDYHKYQYRRKKINTLIIGLAIFLVCIFGFLILKDSDLFKSSISDRNFEYQLYGDTYMVSLSSDFLGEEVEIPETYQGTTITRIGNFSSNTLKKVKIHANITIINDKAFSGCTKLEYVNIPSSVQNIGIGAFENCIALKNVMINGNITEIKDFTFYNCIELYGVSLPNTVKIIGKNAFDGCIKMEGFSMPTNIVNIEDFAFANCRLIDNISFGYNLYSIGNEAFKNCKSLEGILIPASVNKLGDFVFKNCSNLVSFVILDNNELSYVGENILYGTRIHNNFESGLFSTGGWIIFSKGDIGYLNLDNNVSVKAFYENANTITEFNIKNGVKYILDYAFYGIQMDTLILPSSILKIGNFAFFGNEKLRILKIEFNDPYYIYDRSLWKCFSFSSEGGASAFNSNLKIYVSSAYVQLFKDELVDSISNFIKNCILPY